MNNNCLNCGKPLGYRIPKPIRCKSCNAKYLWATKRIGQFDRMGNKNPAWKGGRTINEGYILVMEREHPRANQSGYVREHILIWEQANNKPLPKGWIVHHLNGIKSDNRPQNLTALPNKKHFLVLQAKARRIQELEGLLYNQSQLL